MDTLIRGQHRTAAIRSSLLMAPDSPRTPRAAESVLLAPSTTQPQPERDGAQRAGAIVPIDSQGRAFLGKLLRSLGWEPGATLRVSITGPGPGPGPGRAIVSAGPLERPTQTKVVRDDQGRLCLPPVVLGALELGPGDQVVAAAVPAAGEMHLVAAADVLQTITGSIDAPAPTPPCPPTVKARATQVRARFRPVHTNPN